LQIQVRGALLETAAPPSKTEVESVMPRSTVAARQFSRRHYEAVAEILKRRFANESDDSAAKWVVDAVADDLADLFAADNERFDRQRFKRAACGEFS
jgi:hypothetical protein